MFHFSHTSRSIRFVCRPEDHGVIAPPVAAKTVLPDWFRKLPAVDSKHASATNNGLTVKRCMPFLDAMTTGWILPLAATVRLEIKNDGRAVDAGWEFDRVMVSNHGAHQVAGNPKEPAPPCKFHNYWSIRTPPGWSSLFLPPLNRPAQPFECVAGIVDTDTYAAHINFPFFATAPDGRPYRRAGRGEHIDLAAPGVEVWTAASVSGARPKTGTSFAAPFVAAAAALMKSANSNATAADIHDALGKSAEDLGAPGKDAVFGWGLLNARAACVVTPKKAT